MYFKGARTLQETWKRIISWLAYFLSLVAYIAFFLGELKIEIAALLFTIVLMVLILLESNRSIQNATKRQVETIQESTWRQIQTLQETSEKQLRAIQESSHQQIQVLVEQRDAIVERLGKTVGILSTMSEENRKKVEAEEKRMKVKEERWKQESLEKEAEKERLKPKIFVRIDEQSFFLVWRHYWIYILNAGGDGRDLEVTHRFIHRPYASTSSFSRYFENIRRKQQESIGCGNVDNFRPYSELHMHISVRDVQQRKYEGETCIDKNTRGWVEIGLQEIPGAALGQKHSLG
jgi:ABC-type multidrug transport system fused ATPase/permease subunit